MLVGTPEALDASQLFERHPEEPLESALADALMQVADEAAQLVTEGTSEFGETVHVLHASVTLADAVKSLVEDGLTPLQLSAWWDPHGGQEAPEATLAALDAALEPFEDEEPALIRAIRAHGRSAQGAPPSIDRDAQGHIWSALDELLVPEVERWNDVHRRVLAYVAPSAPPQRVFLHSDTSELGRDRWSMLRGALASVGIDLDKYVEAQLALGVGSVPPPSERVRMEQRLVTYVARWSSSCEGCPPRGRRCVQPWGASQTASGPPRTPRWARSSRTAPWVRRSRRRLRSCSVRWQQRWRTRSRRRSSGSCPAIPRGPSRSRGCWSTSGRS